MTQNQYIAQGHFDLNSAQTIHPITEAWWEVGMVIQEQLYQCCNTRVIGVMESVEGSGYIRINRMVARVGLIGAV